MQAATHMTALAAVPSFSLVPATFLRELEQPQDFEKQFAEALSHENRRVCAHLKQAVEHFWPKDTAQRLIKFIEIFASNTSFLPDTALILGFNEEDRKYYREIRILIKSPIEMFLVLSLQDEYRSLFNTLLALKLQKNDLSISVQVEFSGKHQQQYKIFTNAVAIAVHAKRYDWISHLDIGILQTCLDPAYFLWDHPLSPVLSSKEYLESFCHCMPHNVIQSLIPVMLAVLVRDYSDPFKLRQVDHPSGKAKILLQYTYISDHIEAIHDICRRCQKPDDVSSEPIDAGGPFFQQGTKPLKKIFLESVHRSLDFFLSRNEPPHAMPVHDLFTERFSTINFKAILQNVATIHSRDLRGLFCHKLLDGSYNVKLEPMENDKAYRTALAGLSLLHIGIDRNPLCDLIKLFLCYTSKEDIDTILRCPVAYCATRIFSKRLISIKYTDQTVATLLTNCFKIAHLNLPEELGGASARMKQPRASAKTLLNPIPRKAAMPPKADAKNLEATSQAMTALDHAQALGMYQTLHSLLNKGTFMMDEPAFVEALIQSRGVWKFSCMLLPKVWTLLTTFLSSKRPWERNMALWVVQDLLQFFRFEPPNLLTEAQRQELRLAYASSPSPINEALCQQLLSALCTPFKEKIPHEHLLTERTSVQLAQAFFSLKTAEFRLRTRDKHALFSEKTSPAKQVICYLIAQDAQNAHLELLTAHFDAAGSLAAISQDIDGKAKKKLLELTSAPFVLDSEATLCLADLAILEHHLEEILVLHREEIHPQIEESLHDASERKERAESKRRAREESILIAKKAKGPEKKTIRILGEKVARPESYRDFQPEGAYKDLMVAQAPSRVSTKDKSGSSEKLPRFAPEIKLMSFEDAAAFSYADFWQQMSLKSLQAVVERVAEEDAKVRAIMKVQPLDYPILEKLQRLSLPQYTVNTFPFYNLLLKGYQREQLVQLLEHANHGIFSILASEMGLGKTYVMCEYITQWITKRSGTNLIVVPKSLLPSIFSELQQAIGLAVTRAWQIKGKNNQQDVAAVVEAVQEALKQKNGLALVSLVRSFGYFNENLLYTNLLEAGCLAAHHAAVWKQVDDACDDHRQFLQSRFEKEPEMTVQFQREVVAVDSHDQSKEMGTKALFKKAKTSGAILNIHPDRRGNLARYPQEALERLSRFSLGNIRACDGAQSLQEALISSSQGSSVAVTTFNAVIKLGVDELAKASLASVVVDEAQKFHKPMTQIHTFFKKLMKVLCKEHGPVVLFATGTPLENNFTELWTLLELSNPKGFASTTHSALNKLMKETTKALISAASKPHIDRTNVKELILKSFAHFEICRKQIVAPLIHRVKKEDEHVIKDWNGLIPTRLDTTIKITLSPAVRQAIENAHELYKSNSNVLKYSHAIKRILLSPDIPNDEEFTEDAPGIIAMLKLLQDGSIEEKDALIVGSPSLHGLLSSEQFQEIVREAKQANVIVEHMAAARIMEAAIKHYYRDRPPEVRTFHGRLTTDERSNLIRWYKTASS